MTQIHIYYRLIFNLFWPKKNIVAMFDIEMYSRCCFQHVLVYLTLWWWLHWTDWLHWWSHWSAFGVATIFCRFLTSTASVDVATISNMKTSRHPILLLFSLCFQQTALVLSSKYPFGVKCRCAARVDSQKNAMRLRWRVRTARHLTWEYVREGEQGMPPYTENTANQH